MTGPLALLLWRLLQRLLVLLCELLALPFS